MTNLKQKTIKGLFWSFVSQGGKQASQFIVTAILARLLTPNDFGLAAMATVFVNFAMIFSEMGISSALIQKQDTHDRHYYSAFWLNIFVGVCLTLIFISAASLIAMFYKKPELTPILSVISLNFFFSSFVIIQQTLLTKEMDFKKLAIRDIIAVVISGIIGITLAYKGFGVWSLVFQSVVFTLVNAILLWSVSSWRPKVAFAIADIKDIFHFSANLTGFNIINYFARNVDQLLIGKFLGAQALGYYSLAYKIMLYPLQNISWVISKVMFPAFSKMQNDLEKVRDTYLKMVKAISLVTFPMMFGLFAVAPEFVNVAFGPKWEPIIILIRILCVCGLIQSIHTTVGGVILSQGKSGLQLKLGILSSLFATMAIIIGLNWGVNGVAAMYLIEQIVWITYAQQVANHLINLRLKAFFRPLLKGIIYCVLTVFIIYILKVSLPLNSNNLLMLLMFIMTGAIIYVFFVFRYEKMDVILFKTLLGKNQCHPIIKS